MSSKKINVVIERGIDGSFSAYIADDNCEFGCIGEGKSVEETKADFMKAVGEMQEVYAEEGSKFPDVEFDFIYDMASFLNYYAYAFSLAGLARITGVNQGQLSHSFLCFKLLYFFFRLAPKEKDTKKKEAPATSPELLRHCHCRTGLQLASLKQSPLTRP